ncbi:PAS domain S-box-containing protein/diguanylate cyclase (GGDEF)-like protein [Hoeflea marina]|uniref:PAS domain S-box-containing protein/diguanylate cyclase (GGDEF)-like protein n=2 Tax=Hoeflea marina TaxID=274592 RepID=A0A317PGT1_9HYPH|nr:PAS domain S-box-containing protein/diguanylate cyclase (GGDEF)-like protein [Hoeflea marina]
MIDHVPDYLFVKDMQHRYLIANRTIAVDLGFADPSDLCGKTDADLQPVERARKLHDDELRILQTGKPMLDSEEHVQLSSGTRRWLSTSKLPLHNAAGEIIGIVGVSRDITKRKRSDILLEGQTRVLEMIARNDSVFDVLNSLVQVIEHQMEGVFCSVLLYDARTRQLHHGAAPSLPPAYVDAIDGVTIGASVGSCGTAAYHGMPVVVSDIANDPRWEGFQELAELHGLRSCWSNPILSHQGTVLGTFAMYTGRVASPGAAELELTHDAVRLAAIAIERKHAEDQINHLAHHDALTGLLNRTLLEERIDRAIGEARPERTCLSLVFLDLDNFKLVNDSLGHTAGDTVLSTVARRMQSCVGPGNTIVRIGGDEFVILLAGQADDPAANLEVLERIRAEISKPFMVDGHAFHITCSMGVATYPADGRSTETLLINADAAMYKAKEAGRDNFQFYTTEMNSRVHGRLNQIEELRTAISGGEFHLRYQPQIDLASGRMVSIEALVRWDHPVKGLISPADFIPLAESSGLIVPLGDWVLQEACRQNKSWQDAGLAPLTVCVNVSARQFSDRTWVCRVKHALDLSGLDAGCLELELTESLLMQNMDQAIATMNDLRELGVRFAIDDFGTGYSNLSALKSFPVARLKIDKCFISNLASDDSDLGIVAAIISLGQNLRMKVIAEGVETGEQLEILRRNGCDEVQGFHFSRPVAPDVIGSMLAGHHPVIRPLPRAG